MKKIITLFSALVLAACSCVTVSAKEIPRNPDGSIKYSSNDVVLIKDGDSETISLVRNPLVILDTEPTEDELKSNFTSKYWINCEEPYLIYYDLNKNEIIKEDFELCISYIWDYNENKVYDYETSEELGVIRNIHESEESYQGVVIGTDKETGENIVVRPTLEEPGYIAGDLNFDGKIDVTDLSELSLALADGKEFTDAQQNAVDVDKDGKVTLADLARMRQFLSKTIEAF